MYRVFQLTVHWDGAKLIAKPEFYSGFEELTGTQAPEPKKWTTACSQLEDLTAFELGVFLAAVCRQFTVAWEYEEEPAFQLSTLTETRVPAGDPPW